MRTTRSLIEIPETPLLVDVSKSDVSLPQTNAKIIVVGSTSASRVLRAAPGCSYDIVNLASLSAWTAGAPTAGNVVVQPVDGPPIWVPPWNLGHGGLDPSQSWPFVAVLQRNAEQATVRVRPPVPNWIPEGYPGAGTVAQLFDAERADSSFYLRFFLGQQNAAGPKIALFSCPFPMVLTAATWTCVKTSGASLTMDVYITGSGDVITAVTGARTAGDHRGIVAATIGTKFLAANNGWTDPIPANTPVIANLDNAASGQAGFEIAIAGVVLPA